MMPRLIAAVTLALLPLLNAQSTETPVPDAKTALQSRGLSFSTPDDSFSIRLLTGVQFRMTYSDVRADGSEGINGRDFLNFRVVRARTTITGNLFSKDFRYSVILNWASTASGIIDQAFFTWAPIPELNINAGQSKLPSNYEWLTSYQRFGFVERSFVSQQFAQDWAKGVWLSGRIGKDTPWLKYWAGLYNGVLRSNSDFRNRDRNTTDDTFSQLVDADLMPAIRLETHPLGDVPADSTDSRAAEAHDKVLFAVGLSANWLISRFQNTGLRPFTTSPGSGRASTGHDTLHLALDAQLRVFGLAVNLEYHFRHTEFHNFGPQSGNDVTRGRNRPGNLTDQGASLQVSYYILPRKLDVAARVGWVDGDEYWSQGSGKRFSLQPDTIEAGLGVGYYIHGHNLKIQLDWHVYSHQLAFHTGAVSALPTLGSAPPARSATSAANDVSDYLNVWQLRVQLHWLF